MSTFAFLVKFIFAVLLHVGPAQLQGAWIESVNGYNTSAQVGASANLTCTFSPKIYSLFAVVWEHNSTGSCEQIYRYSPYNGAKKPSQHLQNRSAYFHSAGKTTLSISDIATRDDGHYICYIKGMANGMRGNLHLMTYYDASRSIYFDKNESITVEKHGSLQINVTANCTKPAVEIEWSDDTTVENERIPCDDLSYTTFSIFSKRKVTSSFSVTATAKHPSFSQNQMARTYHVSIEGLKKESNITENWTPSQITERKSSAMKMEIDILLCLGFLVTTIQYLFSN